MKFLVIAIAMAVGRPLFATPLSLMNTTPYDVVVPVSNGDPSGNDKISGMMYFNSSSSPASLNVIDNQGNKITLGVSGANTLLSAGFERIEQVQYGGGTQYSNCTGTAPITCNVYRQSGASGSWFTNVQKTGTGTYTITFVAGAFSAAPTCVATGNSVGNGPIVGFETASSTTSYTFQTWALGTQNDSWANIICMGNR